MTIYVLLPGIWAHLYANIKQLSKLHCSRVLGCLLGRPHTSCGHLKIFFSLRDIFGQYQGICFFFLFVCFRVMYLTLLSPGPAICDNSIWVRGWVYLTNQSKGLPKMSMYVHKREELLPSHPREWCQGFR